MLPTTAGTATSVRRPCAPDHTNGRTTNVTEQDSEGGDKESYGGYSVDDEDQPSNIDGLGDSDVADELDRGYSPPEKWSAGQGYGNTPYEEAAGESLDQRIAQEDPEADPYAEAERGENADETEDLDDGEVGDKRAGRLVDPDQGLGEDTEKDLVADDVGIDGAAASAEEAAVHVVPEPGDL
jgi:Family of unknown function (DUF5709)